MDPWEPITADHLKFQKKKKSQNDRFLIKFCLNIISLDSSQRVPPMSPCPPLKITKVPPD